MGQQIFSLGEQEAVNKGYANVAENWVLYDTVLIGSYVSSMDYNTGWFTTFAALAGVNQIPFFNVRNRSHSLPYNNQDTQSQLPYVFRIFSIGVTFFAPSTTTFASTGPELGAQAVANSVFEAELPKHISVTLRTNQDERLISTALMTPPGYGPVRSGIGQGDFETAHTQPNYAHTSFTQGDALFTNHWGFPNPLEIPRTANLSVVLRLNQYAQHILTNMPGPNIQPTQNIDFDGRYPASGCAGIQVTLGGIREVQQRGQYHA